MTQKLHIGELAARTGRSVHTIRWYEAQGLIPGVERDKGGRRVYSELHLGWLDLVDRLRRTGMSIAEIRDYAALAIQGRRTLRQRQELLAVHRRKVEAAIGEYRDALQLIDGKIAFYEEWIESGRQPPAVPLSEPAAGGGLQVNDSGGAERLRTRKAARRSSGRDPTGSARR
jgi:DNA-binding transcriptional MerR regulator